MGKTLQPTVEIVAQMTNGAARSSIVAMALRRLLMFWSILFALVSLATYLVAPDMLLQSVWIGLASGAISVVALLPSLQLDRVSSEDLGDRQKQEVNAYAITFLGAMAIRVAGTVALFLLCRYQMGLPLPTIALFVCGWYVLLTSVEVSLLVQGTKTLGIQMPTTSTELK